MWASSSGNLFGSPNRVATIYLMNGRNYGGERMEFPGYEWRNGNFDVERSSLDHLVTSQEFMRVR
jgi:hypothetical protein